MLRIVVDQILLPDALHKLIHLPQLLVAHLVNLGLVQLLALPRVALDLLCVCLPFREEANLKECE